MSAAAHDGRFAPSPTGSLHLGNLRTALVAWLAARSAGARFLLRIDDLDPGRSRSMHEARQLDDLRALGIDWDGDPVRQSDRMERYDDAHATLERDGRTYPCFCTRAEVLAAATAPHGPGVEAPYPGTCSRLATAEAARRVDAGEPCCVRIRAEGATIGFDDLVAGRVEAMVDDFVIRRRDGVTAYNLASPVDESDLGIGEVVRGADLAPTTPRQLLVASLLGLSAPRFAHVPLVVGADGARLAKRHGATDLDALREAGLDGTAVLRLLARSLGEAVLDAEVREPADLADGFRIEALAGAPVRVVLPGDAPNL